MSKKEKPVSLRGKFFALTVCAIYAILFFFDRQMALLAIQKSANVLFQVLPILAVVILFTAFLNYILKPKQIARHLGEDSGIKGWFVALFAGVISHGPMYAWYPLIEDLRSHGLKDRLVVVFFYARAIKLPLLPLMIDYFGLNFTIILSCYILLGALFQGWIIELLEQKGIRP
ncbi:MAG: permease [Desulfobulbaceae bacterium]|uniref:Permease n=1 Tax=Candidatus Desulfatifera sulfidica TaxID=2841691 RepID=A0A8J6NAE4_9BACT|nr:permease [Candidatus Desulfatifera sulfidica]